jgi:hypothetical protein
MQSIHTVSLCTIVSAKSLERAKSLEHAKSLERSAKKALNSTKKALYLDFQIFPEKYSPFSILFGQQKFKKNFLKSDY